MTAGSTTPPSASATTAPSRRSSTPNAPSLADAEGNDLTEDNHAECPGHGAVILPGWGGNVRVVWLCTDWKAHGHRDRHGRVTGPMTDEQKEERRQLIATNKAWDSAEQVRRAWLRIFLARKSAPKDAAQYVARTMLASNRTVGAAVSDNNQLLAELLGHDKPTSWGESPLQEAADKATPARAQVLALGVVLAGIESSLDRNAWRNPTREAADYLTALNGWGYELADVERTITDHQADD
jgi:ParB family transcriptional regulator, chromosome partitioning protein